MGGLFAGDGKHAGWQDTGVESVEIEGSRIAVLSGRRFLALCASAER